MNQRRALALRERPARGKRGPSRRTPLLALVAALGALLVVAVAVGLLSTGGGDDDGTLKSATSSAPQIAAGVEVQAPSVDLGRQPLDTQVSHSFVVKNTNARAIELGVPGIEVLDGC